MQATSIESTDPIFTLIQAYVEQHIISITIHKGTIEIKWSEKLSGDAVAVKSKAIVFDSNEMVAMLNTLKKLEAIQSVINHYPVKVTSK